MDTYKEVDFKTYCKKCKYRKLSEVKDPCNDCLSIGSRKDSHKPEYFEEKTKFN